MGTETHKNLNFQINWKFRFFVFLGMFLLSFTFFRYLFKSELDFSLLMSAVLGAWESCTLFAGTNLSYVRKHFKDYSIQSPAYIKVNAFFYCPGRLVIADQKISFITHKLNAKHNVIEVNFKDIEHVNKVSLLVFSNSGLKITLINSKTLKFVGLKESAKYIETINSYS